MIRSAVVLPAPDGPSRPMICGLPRMLPIVSEKPRSAAKVPPSFIGNSLPTSSTRSRVSSITGGPESGPGKHFDWSSNSFLLLTGPAHHHTHAGSIFHLPYYIFNLLLLELLP